MTYTKQTWVNGPSGNTPISAERLNHIEDGIESVAVDVAAVVGPDDAAIAALINNPASDTTSALAAQYAPIAGPVAQYSTLLNARPGDAFPPIAATDPTVSFQPSSYAYTNRKIWTVGPTASSAARWWGFPTLGYIGTSVTGPDSASYQCFRDAYSTGAGQGAASYWEFMSDAPILELMGSYNPGSPIYFEINGQPAASLAITPNNQYLRVIHTTRQMRRFRFYAFNGFQLAGITTDQVDSVFPTASSRPRLGIMGDSYCGGSVAAAGRPFSLPYILGETLGVDVVVSQVGGTGYIADNTSYETYVEREPFYDGVSLSAMLWLGGINDTVSGLQAAATTAFENFAASHPDTPQFALGPFYPTATSATSQADKFTAIQTAIESVGGTFIDNSGWVTGTGYNTAEAGNGNADVITNTDGTHPSTPLTDSVNGIGATFYAVRIAEALKQAATTERGM